MEERAQAIEKRAREEDGESEQWKEKESKS